MVHQTFHLEPLTDAEVQQLLRACSNRASTGVRNRALIVTLYRGGLRISESLSLRPKDLDPTAGTIRVLKGKGSRSRTVGIDPGAMAIIERWMDVRTSLGVATTAPIFCTLKGRKGVWDGKGVWNFLGIR